MKAKLIENIEGIWFHESGQVLFTRSRLSIKQEISDQQFIIMLGKQFSQPKIITYAMHPFLITNIVISYKH